MVSSLWLVTEGGGRKNAERRIILRNSLPFFLNEQSCDIIQVYEGSNQYLLKIVKSLISDNKKKYYI